jgi:hypothetical protein
MPQFSVRLCLSCVCCNRHLYRPRPSAITVFELQNTAHRPSTIPPFVLCPFRLSVFKVWLGFALFFVGSFVLARLLSLV